MPPPQHSAAMKPDLARAGVLEPAAPERGETPSMTMNSVNVRLTIGTVQLHDVVNSSAKNDWLAQAVRPRRRAASVIGSQNTEKP